MKIKLILLSMISMGFCFLCGCGDNSVIVAENKSFAAENYELVLANEALESKNKSLENQIVTIKGMAEDVRVSNLITVERVDLAGRTGFYDKDLDNIEESLVVYFKAFDEDGDAMKVSGSMHIELWNLEASPENAKVAEWDITPEQMRENYAARLVSNYHRMIFDVKDILLENKNASWTINVEFVDYPTGKKFSKQIAIDN